MLGGNICCWLLLFQEFDFEIVVKPGRLNTEPDHLLRLETWEEMTNLEDALLDAKLFAVKMVKDYYEDIIHFLTTRKAQDDYNTIQNKKLVVKYVDFQLIIGKLYNMG